MLPLFPVIIKHMGPLVQWQGLYLVLLDLKGLGLDPQCDVLSLIDPLNANIITCYHQTHGSSGAVTGALSGIAWPGRSLVGPSVSRTPVVSHTDTLYATIITCYHQTHGSSDVVTGALSGTAWPDRSWAGPSVWRRPVVFRTDPL